jgi:hypothetical protein
MKIAAYCIALLLCFCFLAVYGMAVREQEINYDSLQLVDLQTVACVDGNGNLNSYQVMLPSFEGFTKANTLELEKKYKQGFCKSVGGIDGKSL